MSKQFITTILSGLVLCILTLLAIFVATGIRPRNSREFLTHACYFAGTTLAFAFLWSLLFL